MSVDGAGSIPHGNIFYDKNYKTIKIHKKYKKKDTDNGVKHTTFGM